MVERAKTNFLAIVRENRIARIVNELMKRQEEKGLAQRFHRGFLETKSQGDEERIGLLDEFEHCIEGSNFSIGRVMSRMISAKKGESIRVSDKQVKLGILAFRNFLSPSNELRRKGPSYSLLFLEGIVAREAMPGIREVCYYLYNPSSK